MADYILITELQLLMEQLKSEITVDLPGSKLADMYCKIIDGFTLFCKEVPNFNPAENVPCYFKQVTGVDPYMHPVTRDATRKARAVLFIRDTLNGKRVARRYSYNTVPIPEVFCNDIILYTNWLILKGCSHITIRTRIGRLKPFFIFAIAENCTSVENLNPSILTKFIGTLNGKYSSTGKTNILYTIKSYFACPDIENKLQFNISTFLDNLHTNKHERLGSFYSAEEIRKVLACVDRSSGQGKMLYLIMLFAIVYGLRSSDIRNLQFSNIEWRKQKIKLYQQKTRQYLELPLTHEICLALLDYIKNARPEADSPYIFITQRPPHTPYSDGNHFSSKVRVFFLKAGINVEKKHAGLHSMRHSLATGMMSDGVQINEIATILGHTSPQSTTRYIWSDISQLRKASMEVIPYGK